MMNVYNQIKKISCIKIASKLGLQGKNGNYHCFRPSEHNNNDIHPSLQISEHGFKCHGCGIKGNNIELVQLVQNCSSIEAHSWIKEIFGLEYTVPTAMNELIDTISKKQFHIRRISSKEPRYIHISENEALLRTPTLFDVNNIKHFLYKCYSLETLLKSGIKINQKSGSYGIVFPTGTLNYNPQNNAITLHLEGRTDWLTAIEMGLDKNFNLVSEYNKTSQISCSEQRHIFVMDQDDNEKNIRERLHNNSYMEVKFIRLPPDYKDLSDYFNAGKWTAADLIILFESVGYTSIDQKQTGGIEAVPISSDTHDIKNYASQHKLICVGSTLYQYDDGFYQELSDAKVKQEIAESLGKYTTTVSTILEGIKTFAERQSAEVNPPRFINLENGIYDTEEFKLLPHDPEIFCTVRIPIKYNETSKCQQFSTFIDQVIPDMASQLALQEYLGYCLSTLTEYHKALFLIGTGSNGKGVLLNIINKFYGKDNISYLDIGDLSGQYNRADLFGKLINISSEMSGKMSPKDFKYFKQATSFERLDARHPYGRPFSFQPMAKFIFSSNQRPQFPEHNVATFRRLLFIDFPNEFSEEKGNIDINLFRTLCTDTELEGIFLWKIEGLSRLRENQKFSQDEYMSEQINRFKINNDSIGMFISDCCEFMDDSKIKKSTLYEAYKKYCEYYGTTPMTHTMFGRRILSQPGVRSDTNAGGYYRGFSIEVENNTDLKNSIESALGSEQVISTFI